MENNSTFALGMFAAAGCRPFCGVVFDERVIAAHALLPNHRADTLSGLLEDWPANFAALQDGVRRLRDGHREAEMAVSSASAGLLMHAPLDSRRQLFCSGANYRKHVIEMIIDRFPEDEDETPEQRRATAEKMMDGRARSGQPYIFCKPASSIAGPFDPLPIAPLSAEPDWEVELGVVFGRAGHRVARDQAMSLVAGYVLVNDVSNRSYTFRKELGPIGSDWVRSKGQPGYLPMGPLFLPAAFLPDPANLRLELRVNGQLMQDETTADMIYDIPRQIEYLTGVAAVVPGDVLCTGSPSGNGTHYGTYLKPGDVIEATAPGLGVQRITCVEA